MSLSDRILGQSQPEPNSGCWLWTGADDGNGYGTLTVGRVMRKAHLYSYEAFVGPIPEGLQLDHLCRVRCCVNPDHLEPVTQRENILRGMGIAAVNARKTFCKHGHEFSAENTRVRKNGTRQCRACHRTISLKYLHTAQAEILAAKSQ